MQETQRAAVKPLDFPLPVENDSGYGQLILIRKSIKYRELDVSRWSSRNLHLVAVELAEQPVRNVVNVYAFCTTMKEQDWMALDELQKTLPGETMLCGDFKPEEHYGVTPFLAPKGRPSKTPLTSATLDVSMMGQPLEWQPDKGIQIASSIWYLLPLL